MSSAVCSLLLAVSFMGPVVSQNIRSRNGGDEATNDNNVINNFRGPHRKVKTVIEIKELQKDGITSRTKNTLTSQRQMVHKNELEKDLETIFSEELDHWDRMLEVYSLTPTKPPYTKPPTNTKPPTYTSEPPVESPSSTPSYLPTIAPAGAAAKPTFYPTFAPKPTEEQTDVPIETPTPAGSNITDPPKPTDSPSTTTAAPSVTEPTAETARPTILPATTWDILLSRSEEFSTLIAASQAVGFDQALQSDEDRTIFAPSNAAFNNLVPADLLEKYFDFEAWTGEYIFRLLFCHDIAGSIIFSFQFQNGTKVLPCLDFLDPAFLITTPPLQISKDTMPTPAIITEGDLLARNGVVHVIDQVLTNSFLRLALPEAANALGGFEVLLDLIDTAGLLDLLSGPGPFTVFAPPDDVFLGYGEDFIETLKQDPDTLREILLNHVVADVIIPCCQFDGATYESAAGFPIVIENVDTSEPRDYTVNGVQTITALTGLLVSNAKVNAISDILSLPSATVAPVVSPSVAPVTTISPTPLPTPANSTLSPTLKESSAPPVSEAPTNGDSLIPSLGETSVSPISESPTQSGPTLGPVPAATVWDIIIASPEQFATFISAAEAVGYDDVIRTSNEITVFAPNEEAFANLMPPNLLTKYFATDIWTREYILLLLNCHDIAGAAIVSSELNNGAEFATCMDLLDPEFQFSSPPPVIKKSTMPVPATIIGPDQESFNGVVHTVDQVLTTSFLRFDMPTAADKLGTFTILLELVVFTDLLTFVSGEGPFTIFAPSDSVFQRYGPEFIEGLKMDMAGTRDLLLNHVVADQIVPCCLSESTEFTSAAGFPLLLDGFSREDRNVFKVNGIDTVPMLTNFLSSNAKITEITDFLLPPNIQ